jgi:hypothetical protein
LIGLESLSQCVIGLAEQTKSYRRDVLKHDYLNKFYEDYLMPLERQNYIKEYEKAKY